MPSAQTIFPSTKSHPARDAPRLGVRQSHGRLYLGRRGGESADLTKSAKLYQPTEQLPPAQLDRHGPTHPATLIAPISEHPRTRR